MSVPLRKVPQVFGQTVRAARTEKSLSQEQLAERSDLAMTYVGEVERAEKMPSLETIVKLSRGLGTTAQELLGRARL